MSPDFYPAMCSPRAIGTEFLTHREKIEVTRHDSTCETLCGAGGAGASPSNLRLGGGAMDSNPRFRWLSPKRADFRDFPFSAKEPDRSGCRCGYVGSRAAFPIARCVFRRALDRH
jgi:hypothetical protein